MRVYLRQVVGAAVGKGDVNEKSIINSHSEGCSHGKFSVAKVQQSGSIDGMVCCQPGYEAKCIPGTKITQSDFIL